MNGKTKLKYSLVGWLLPISALIHEFFARSFAVVENYGISFGIKGINTGILILVCMFVGVVFWKQKAWPVGLIFVGGLVNMMDRLRFGFVRDYWQVPFLGLINNLNDWIIYLGVVLWIYLQFTKKSE